MPLEFAWAKLDALLAEGLEDMAFADFEEVEVDRDKVPLAIDWQHYRHLEKLGTYRIIAAHADGVLAGYNAFFINRHTRAKDTLQAVNDVLYLAPEHRQGMNGARFLKESDQMLVEIGARKVQYGIKLGVRIGARAGTVGDLLRHLGYNHIEQVYAKAL